MSSELTSCWAAPLRWRRAGWTRGAACAVALAYLSLASVANAGLIYHVNNLHPMAADNNPGTVDRPLKTIGACTKLAGPGDAAGGDVCEVHEGRYLEEVTTGKHGADEQHRVTIRAVPANNPDHPVVVKGFTIRHRFVTIEGFTITKHTGQSQGHVAVYPDSGNCRIQNNTIKDGVYVIGDDFIFDDAAKSVTSMKSNFVAAGFVPGVKVYLGANSVTPYANHDVGKTIASLSPDGHTMVFVESLLPEPKNPNYAILMLDESFRAGVSGVGIYSSSQLRIRGCVIKDNIFKDIFGRGLTLFADDVLVEGNTFIDAHGFNNSLVGSNLTFRRNTWRDSPHFVLYDDRELSLVDHNSGRFMDFQLALFHSGGPAAKNVIFEENILVGMANQLFVAFASPDAYGLTIKNNVWVGFFAHMSAGRSGMSFLNNTYYKAPFESETVVAFGPASGETLIDTMFHNNVFADIGTTARLDAVGAYSPTGVAPEELDVDYNFVTGKEQLGFPPRAEFNGKEVHGVNGGDPLFADPSDPFGPDGVAWTEDDGLAPLPNSPLCPQEATGNVQRGAYACKQCFREVPFARYTIAFPQWLAADAVKARYDLPVVLGYAPQKVTFDGSASVSCTAGHPRDGMGIVEYVWRFGDGQQQTSATPTVEHVFSQPGDYRVMLTVRNSSGRQASYARTYSVRPSVPHMAFHISFDDAIFDASGRNHLVSVTAAPAPVVGKFGNGNAFGGTGSTQVVVDHRDDLDGIAQLTLAGWAKRDSASSSGFIVIKPLTYALKLDANNSVTGEVYAPTRVRLNVPLGTVANDQNWHHYAMVLDGTALKLYVDGVAVAGGSTPVVAPVIRHRDRDVSIGKDPFGASFAGCLDEVQMYTTALSAAELTALQTAPSLTVGPPPLRVSIGSDVVALININPRTMPASSASFVGNQALGARGKIIAGPVTANGVMWWNVDYDGNSYDGWSDDRYLAPPPVTGKPAPSAPVKLRVVP